jgi:hypothetical protein
LQAKLLLPAENRLGQGSQGTCSCGDMESIIMLERKGFFCCYGQCIGRNEYNIEWEL